MENTATLQQNNSTESGLHNMADEEQKRKQAADKLRRLVNANCKDMTELKNT